MRLLITGSTGFVGRNFLLQALKSKKYSEIVLPVRSIDKLRAQFIGDGFEEIPAGVTPIVASASDWNLPADYKADHVVHSAGVVVGRNRNEYFKTNCDGTRHLFTRLSPSCRIVVLSSQTAAGPSPENSHSRSEKDKEEPLTWYGESKLEMERMLKKDFGHHNYICIRPPMIFGARDTATLPLFKMVRQPFHFKPGFRVKSYSYISIIDLLRALDIALHSPEDWTKWEQREFFVAAKDSITDTELLTAAARVSQKWGFVFRVPQPVLRVASEIIEAVPAWRRRVPPLTKDRAREIWPDRWLITSEAFSERFGWEPFEDLKTVLTQTHEWYVRTGQLS